MEFALTTSGGSGPPLVLLHGALVDLEMWHELGYTAALRDEHWLILKPRQVCETRRGSPPLRRPSCEQV